MGREPTYSTNVRAEEQPGLAARVSPGLAFFVGVDTPGKPVLSVDEVAELDPPIGFTLDRGDCPPRLPRDHRSEEEVDRQHRADVPPSTVPGVPRNRAPALAPVAVSTRNVTTEQQGYGRPCGSHDGASVDEGANDKRKVLELGNVGGYLRHVTASEE